MGGLYTKHAGSAGKTASRSGRRLTLAGDGVQCDVDRGRRNGRDREHATPSSSSAGSTTSRSSARDMAETVAWYEDKLGMKLVKTLELPGGRGQHFFLDMGNGVDGIAFFWFPDAPEGVQGRVAPEPLRRHRDRHDEPPRVRRARPSASTSTARSSSTRASRSPRSSTTRTRSTAATSPTTTPATDDGDVFIRSMYFKDPNGTTLEFACWTKVLDESDVRHAPATARTPSTPDPVVHRPPIEARWVARDASHPAPPRPLGRVLGHRRGRPRSRRSTATPTTPTRRRCSTTSSTAIQHPARVARPAVRRGWLEHGPGPDDRRGARRLRRGRLGRGARPRRRRAATGARPSTATSRSSAARTAGPAPAASTTRRASCTGSSTASAATRASVNSYSLGASEVILPHVVGGARRGAAPGDDVEGDPRAHRAGRRVRRHERRRTRAVSPGGVTRHTLRAEPRRGRPRAASTFELFSPLRSDLPADVRRRRGTRSCPAPTPR